MGIIISMIGGFIVGFSVTGIAIDTHKGCRDTRLLYALLGYVLSMIGVWMSSL